MYFREGSSANYIKRGDKLFKGTSICCSQKALTISRSGILKISNFKDKRTYFFKYTRPIDRLEFLVNGKVALIDACEKIFYEFNPLPSKKGEYLSCGAGLSLAAYRDETCTFDEAWEISMQSNLESEVNDDGLPCNKGVLLRNECIYPGEAIVGDDAFLFFDGGITILTYASDPIQLVWKSPIVNAQKLAFTSDGDLCLMGHHGSVLWRSLGGRSALAMRPFVGGLSFFSDANCTKRVYDETSISCDSSLRSFSRFSRRLFSPHSRSTSVSKSVCTFEKLFQYPSHSRSAENASSSCAKDPKYFLKGLQVPEHVERVSSTSSCEATEATTFHIHKSFLGAYDSLCSEAKLCIKHDMRKYCQKTARVAFPNCTTFDHRLICSHCLSQGNQRRSQEKFSSLDLVFFLTLGFFLVVG